MERKFDWKSTLETRFDRFLALKLGLEMEKLESVTSIPSHPFCNFLVDKALYSTYLDIVALGDDGLFQKMNVHIELLKHILKVV